VIEKPQESGGHGPRWVAAHQIKKLATSAIAYLKVIEIVTIDIMSLLLMTENT